MPPAVSFRGPSVLPLLIAFTGAALCPATTTSAQVPDLTAAQWKEDLQTMAEQMPEVHVNLFHTMPRAQFEAAVWDLHRRIPGLADHEVIVEFARIVALVDDGHTRLWLTPNRRNGFQQVPILLYWLEDGLYVLGAPEAHRGVVGGRVVGVGNLSTVEAWERVRALVARDNEMGIRAVTPRYLEIPEVLHALRVTEGIDRVRFTVEDAGGRQREIELAAIPDPHLRNLSARPYLVTTEDDQLSLVMANEGGSDPPLWLSDPGSRFWFRYLPESRTMYVQLNAIRNEEEESMADFFERVFEEVDARPVERFVLDLRLNGGGNNFLNLPVVHGIIARNAINRRGRLFVIVGRHTFSAASHLVTYLERHTNALFVGEPTAGSPNHFGDADPIVLPHSGLRIGASTIFWQNSLPAPFETRDWTAPDLPAELTIGDYRNNHDPAMDAILAYEARPPLRDQLLTALEREGVDAVVRAYRAFRAHPQNAAIDTEGEMNVLGYDLLDQGRTDAAVAVFRLNAETYPGSANVHDSLGDGFLAAGDTTGAIQSYARALRVDPQFSASLSNLERLSQ